MSVTNSKVKINQNHLKENLLKKENHSDFQAYSTDTEEMEWDFNTGISRMLKFLTCHTPTMALAIRMSKITKGSTKAVIVSSPSSNQARTWKQHRNMKLYI